MENIFCHALGADNLARNDMAYDAVLRDKNLSNICGVGLKTFLAPTDKSMQKIAEFNKLSHKLKRDLADEILVKRLAGYRNTRIKSADTTYGVTERIYHCVARREKYLLLFEEGYHPIDVDNINVISKSKASIFFTDSLGKYKYNFSKSTLYKNFCVPNYADKLEISILPKPYDVLIALRPLFKDSYVLNDANKIEDPIPPQPYDILNEIRNLSKNQVVWPELGIHEHVILPLYSTNRKDADGGKWVPLRSGLNQWNAAGRPRDYGEVYIPIPADIHSLRPTFFPPRNTPFRLKIPTGKILNARVCQDGSKALMTNPNKALAEWLLRGVLGLDEKQVLDYNRLLTIGVDSVIISKLQPDLFSIDFTKLDSYEKFLKRRPRTIN